MIQSALGLEDDERGVHYYCSYEDEDQEVPENRNEVLPDQLEDDKKEFQETFAKVLHDFFNSRSLKCSNCKIYIRRVKVQDTQVSEKNRSMALARTLTSKLPGEKNENLLRRTSSKFITLGSEECSSKIDTEVVSLDESANMVKGQRNRGRKWRIQKCIVLGGLFESITSLVIVTSAASIDLLDGSIVALAFTNLFTGLFIIRHNLPRLQKNNPNYEGTELGGWSHYKEELKDKMISLLHFAIAFLSFIFFGLVPPFVYALFSFHNSTGNKELKLVATAGASLLCTAFLAIQKAHIGRPENWVIYIKTAAIYVSIGIGAFVLSYLAGYMFGQLTKTLP